MLIITISMFSTYTLSVILRSSSCHVANSSTQFISSSLRCPMSTIILVGKWIIIVTTLEPIKSLLPRSMSPKHFLTLIGMFIFGHNLMNCPAHELWSSLSFLSPSHCLHYVLFYMTKLKTSRLITIATMCGMQRECCQVREWWSRGWDTPRWSDLIGRANVFQ